MYMRARTKRSKIAVSAVIGTVIMFAMLLSVAGSYFYFIQQDQASFQKAVAQSNNNLLNGQSQEHLTVYGISQSGELAFYINNTGISISIVSYWVLNGTSGSIIQYKNVTTSTSLPFLIGQGQSATLNAISMSPTIIIPPGATYVIKVLTSRGTQGVGTYPSQQLTSATVNSLVAGGFGSLEMTFSSFNWYSYTGGPPSSVSYNIGGNPTNFNNLCANSLEKETNCNGGSYSLDVNHPHSGSLVPSGYNSTHTYYTTSTTTSIIGGLALDGSTGAGTESKSVSASLTTTSSNDVIIVTAGTSSSSTTVKSVTDTGGHTWTHRQTKTGSPSVSEEEWYTIAATSLTADSITVTWSASGDNVFSAFGVSGANTASPFDPHSGLPATATGSGTSPTVSVSTSHSNDFIFGLLANEHTSAAICHTETLGGGFSQIDAENSLGSNTCMNSDQEYQVVSSTQNNLGIPFSTNSGGSNQWAEIGDAIQSGSSSTTTTTITSSSPTSSSSAFYQVPVAFSVNITNDDPTLGTIVLNSASNLWVVETCDSGVTEGNCPSGNPFFVFYIMNVNPTTGAVTSTSQNSFAEIVIPYGVTKTVYYGAAYDLSIQPFSSVGLTTAISTNPFYYGQFSVFLLFSGTKIVSPTVLVYGQNIPFESTTAADNFGWILESPSTCNPGNLTTFTLSVNDSIFAYANPTNQAGISNIQLNASAFSSISVSSSPTGWSGTPNSPSTGYITWSTGNNAYYIANGTTDTFTWKGTAPTPASTTQYIFPITITWTSGQITTLQSALACTVA